MKRVFILLLILNTLLESESLVQMQVKGIAPEYSNSKITLSSISDFISNKENQLASDTINEKGYFNLTVSAANIKNAGLQSIQKYILRVNNSYAYLYLENRKYYNIEFPLPEYIASSNSEVELTFFDIDSTDINYKILGFQAWMDTYLSEIYYSKEADHAAFIKNIQRFKQETTKVYSQDSSTYLLNFIKYSIAQTIDNIPFLGAPSLTDKYNFYFSSNPILYQNDAYIDYLKGFYKRYLYQLEGNNANEFYNAVASSDLPFADSILRRNSFLKNTELRELVLLNILREEYYSNYLPKSGTLQILLQLQRQSDFTNIRNIASALYIQFNGLSIGSKFPDIILDQSKLNEKLSALKGKYIYVHCYNPSNKDCISELKSLKKLQEKYGKDISFITLYSKSETTYTATEQRNLDVINWPKYGFDVNNEIWEQLQVNTFPYYLLIDDSFHLYSAPALSPTPNGKYETIEKTFYDLVHKEDE